MTRSVPAGAGILPFVSVTGRPTEEAVRATVERVAASGAGALMPYARAGLEIDYLGEAWLRAMSWFCRAAGRRYCRPSFTFCERLWLSC